MGLLSLIDPSCAELATRLAKGEYERAPFWVRLAVRLHLRRCELCDRYARQLGLVAEAFRRAAEERGAGELEGLQRRLRERFRK